jgi:hypothetical protein
MGNSKNNLNMKNSVVLFCTICTIICGVIFIDGVANFSTLPFYQIVMRSVSLVMAFAGLLMAFITSKKQ